MFMKNDFEKERKYNNAFFVYSACQFSDEEKTSHEKKTISIPSTNRNLSVETLVQENQGGIRS